MGIEEQKEEREVLDSIFPDEITATLLLHVSYPSDYPDTAPDLDISLPPNAAKIPLLDLPHDKPTLLSALHAAAEENLGMAMVFTLVSTLKDSAEGLMAERAAAAQEVHELEARKAEEAENAKFHGERVTRESFLRWRDAFFAEMAEDERKRKEEREGEDKRKKGASGAAAAAAAAERKMTGRELWEGGFVGKGGDEEDGDGEDALGAEVERLKVEA
ncbi:MAG: hypothetical protein M1819_002952 [Sarea resinae]|nr:MAG: hypothetical protein M1819_002952 [Sarea resinae]